MYRTGIQRYDISNADPAYIKNMQLVFTLPAEVLASTDRPDAWQPAATQLATKSDMIL